MLSPSKDVILIEFNELTPSLVSQFANAGHLPNFQKFHDEAEVYTTDAKEEGELLNPWVQWATVHSGLSTEEHGITHLSEARKIKGKTVWDVLSGAGRRVWVCGSMNAGYDEPLNGHLLPDPWTTDVRPYPEGEFEPYYKFVSRAVQEHTAEDGCITKKDAFRFVAYMLRRGLSLRTIKSTLAQLWGERQSNNRWKRAVIMDQFQWDLFRRHYRTHRPDFSTFFLNSTAHFQHVYWRHMEPERFQVKPSADELQAHKDAILFGYRKMDEILGGFLKLAGPQTTLIFCTALSQQPYVKMEDAGGKHFYRLRNPSALKELLLIPGEFDYEPVMSEEFLLHFHQEICAIDAEKILDSYTLKGEPAFAIARSGKEILAKCQYTGRADSAFELEDAKSARRIPFFDVFYAVDAIKSGFHHPDGMLWVRRPDRRHGVFDGKISLQSIAPAVLEMLDVAPPAYMSAAPFDKAASQTGVAVCS